MKLPDWLKPHRPHRFHGGLHVPGHKNQSTQTPSRALPLADHYHLSLRQRNGLLQTPLVKPGDHILRGQTITLENGAGSVPRHAPTSGTVIAITDMEDIHPSGQSAPAIIIRPDGHDRAAPTLPALDWPNEPPQTLLERIHQCGISGLGGAGFPTARKLKHPTKTLIVNAAECEPYITCDDMQIREHAANIIQGAQITAHILGADTIHFGIEDDKPHAIAALEHAIAHSADPRIRLTAVPTRYPSGNSRQLFELLLGIRVPTDRHAAEYGLICHNSATIKAIRDAILLGEPLTERYVTLTGEALAHPQVVRARIGTPIDWLINQAGGTIGDARLIIGGPMMGHAQTISRAGIKKTTNCLLLLPATPAPREENCIRCARCADACPMELLPQQLYWYSRNGDGKRLDQYRLFDCIECGICASVCPSAIPLVDYYRHSKAAIRADKRKQQAAEHAKTRHDARLARLEREAQEREAKMAAKRAALQQQTAPNPDPAPPAPASTSDRRVGFSPPSDALPHEERGRGEGEQSLPEKAPEPFNPTAQAPADPNKNDAIAAAKARAAARKAARLAQTNPPTEPAISPEPATAPDITPLSLRERGRGEGGNSPTEPETSPEPATTPNRRVDFSPPSDALPHEERGRGEAEQSLPEKAPEPFNPTAQAPADPSKNDAIAAAKARAAARKAARLAQTNPPAEPETSAEPATAPDITPLSLRERGRGEGGNSPTEPAISPEPATTPNRRVGFSPPSDALPHEERENSPTTTEPFNPTAQAPADPSKNNAIAAAKARAAARKAARLAQHTPPTEPETSPEPATTPNRRVGFSPPSGETEQPTDTTPDPLAAAKARAVARKAARAAKNPPTDNPP